MLIQIPRKKALSLYPKFPLQDGSIDFYFYPPVYKEYTLTLNSKTAKGHIAALAKKLSGVAKDLGHGHMIFLGDHTGAYLYRDNEYIRVQEAREYLKNNEVGPRFNGALKVELNELPVFLKHMYWLTRSNAAFPDVHFTDEKQTALWHICKYGNVHLGILNSEAAPLIKNAIDKNGLEFFKGEHCYNMFSKSSAIKGRQTVV